MKVHNAFMQTRRPKSCAIRIIGQFPSTGSVSHSLSTQPYVTLYSLNYTLDHGGVS